MVVWNKAYRLDFVREHGFRFPKGYYEDLPWTYPAMLIAQRIAILDRVCYHYRQRRPATSSAARTVGTSMYSASMHGCSPTSTRTPSSSDGGRSCSGGWSDTCSRSSAKPRRVSPRSTGTSSSVRRILRRATAGELQDAGGPTGSKLRAVARRDYPLSGPRRGRAGRAHREARDQKRRGAGLAQVSKAERGLIRAYYRAELRRPVDENLAVYSAYWSELRLQPGGDLREGQGARTARPWRVGDPAAARDRIPAGVDT